MAGLYFRTQSALDGQPIIVAVVLPKSAKNSKTGALAQVYILPAAAEPHKAWQDGSYSSVCGDCPHKAFGSCYVDRTKGSLGVYRAVHRGISYSEVTPEAFGLALAGQPVRLGADGDPAAIPADQLALIMAHVTDYTGYTHQWRTFPHLSAYCMASCDSPSDQAAAAADGWRTFRTRMDASEALGKHEFLCPASHEAGQRKTCLECLACDGIGANGRRGNPTIIAHGVAHKVTKYKAFRIALAA